MAKAKKSNSSKAVVGKAKHRSFRLTPKTFLVGIALVGAFSVIGVLGYNKVTSGSFIARANNWANMGSIVVDSTGAVHVKVCKSGTSHRWQVTNTSKVVVEIKNSQNSTIARIQGGGHTLNLTTNTGTGLLRIVGKRIGPGTSATFDCASTNGTAK